MAGKNESRMITVRLSRPYRNWVGGAKQVHLPAEAPVAVRSLLAWLAETFSSFPALPQDDARLRACVLVYRDGAFLHVADAVPPGAEVELLPPTAGG